jgi:hypothetical protein
LESFFRNQDKEIKNMIEILQNIYHYILNNFVFVTGVLAGMKWVWEYSQSRKFEKNKFLYDKISEFDDLENTKFVKKMLDWNKFKIKDGLDIHFITDDILIEALTTHDKKNQFNPTEVWIRDQFDEWLDNINELIILSECGLIDKKNLKRMLKYWIDILNGTKKVKRKEFSVQIQNYLLYYGYHDVAAFIKH